MRPPLPPFITYPVKTASVLKISLERFSQPPRLCSTAEYRIAPFESSHYILLCY